MTTMLVAACVVFAHQAGRCEALAAAARYSELLVELPVSASPETRQRAEYLSQLIHYLQKNLWLYYAGDGKPRTIEEYRNISTNLLCVQRDIVGAVSSLGYRRGVVESWQIQMPLFDVLERDAIRYRDACGMTGRFSAMEPQIGTFRTLMLAFMAQDLTDYTAALGTRGLSQLGPATPRPAMLVIPSVSRASRNPSVW